MLKTELFCKLFDLLKFLIVFCLKSTRYNPLNEVPIANKSLLINRAEIINSDFNLLFKSFFQEDKTPCCSIKIPLPLVKK